jgi:branched-chain amino acid transport system permease protein
MKTGKLALAAGLLAYIGVPLLLGNNNYVMSLIIAALVIGGIALAWALLGNLGGMVSFGHSAFFGVGAYVSALLTMQAGVPVMAGLLLGGLGAVLASVVMLPVLRLRGPYFALAIFQDRCHGVVVGHRRIGRLVELSPLPAAFRHRP